MLWLERFIMSGRKNVRTIERKIVIKTVSVTGRLSRTGSSAARSAVMLIGSRLNEKDNGRSGPNR